MTDIDKSKQKINKNDLIHLGKYYDSNNLFGKINDFKYHNKNVVCDNFPLFVSGSCGSGKTHFLLSLAEQFIENNSGLIYIDGKGDSSIYSYLFSLCDKHDRTDDIYVVNFLNQSEYYTHTIDLINPLIYDKSAFDVIAGSVLAPLIQSLCISKYEYGSPITIYDLNCFLSLDNLKMLMNYNMFIESHYLINEYLDSVDYYSNKQHAIKKHSEHSKIYSEFLNDINNHTYLFSTDPNISIDNIYKKNKILLINFPALEKAPTLISDLFLKQIMNAKYKNLHSGVFLEDFVHYLKKYDIDKNDNRKFIFSTSSINNLNNNELIKKTDSFIFMKQDMIYNYYNKDLKFKFSNNLKHYSIILNSGFIDEQSPGEAYFITNIKSNKYDKSICNNKMGSYFMQLKVDYKDIKLKNIFINKKKL